MLRLLGLVLSIGLADSMNPTTIAPGLYLATGACPRRELIQFTLGVFGVSALAGALIVIGPGQAVLALVPHPGATTRYILETVAGAVVLLVGIVLWRVRRRLSERSLPVPKASGRSSAWLGVTIMVVELPTAFPYFAAIAAIVGSGRGLGHELILVAIYNACFVLPLLGILGVVVFAGDRAAVVLSRGRAFLERRWPVLLATLALAAGVFVTTLGVTGLVGQGRGGAANLSRHFRHLITHG